jgi:hypothetical protein
MTKVLKSITEDLAKKTIRQLNEVGLPIDLKPKSSFVFFAER